MYLIAIPIPTSMDGMTTRLATHLLCSATGYLQAIHAVGLSEP